MNRRHLWQPLWSKLFLHRPHIWIGSKKWCVLFWGVCDVRVLLLPWGWRWGLCGGLVRGWNRVPSHCSPPSQGRKIMQWTCLKLIQQIWTKLWTMSLSCALNVRPPGLWEIFSFYGTQYKNRPKRDWPRILHNSVQKCPKKMNFNLIYILKTTGKYLPVRS